MLLLLSFAVKLCCQSAPALTPLRGNRHSGVVARGNKISHWYLHIILYFEQDVKNYFLKMVGPPRGYTANSDFGNQYVDTYTNDP